MKFSQSPYYPEQYMDERNSRKKIVKHIQHIPKH